MRKPVSSPHQHPLFQLRLFLVSRYEADGSYIAVPAPPINASQATLAMQQRLAELPRLVCELAARQVAVILQPPRGLPDPVNRTTFLRPYIGYKSGKSSGARGTACANAVAMSDRLHSLPRGSTCSAYQPAGPLGICNVYS